MSALRDFLHLKRMKNDPSYLSKVKYQQEQQREQAQAQDYASAHAGIGDFIANKVQGRKDAHRDAYEQPAIPLRKPDQAYDPSTFQGLDEKGKARERIDAMIASGNPAMIKQAQTLQGAVQTEFLKAPDPVGDWSVADANTYRDDYRADIKDFDTQIKSFKTMLSSATPDPKTGKFSPAGDKALVYRFAKILDPTGIVTESDFENARAAGGLDTRIEGILSSMENGLLPDSVRADILNVAGNIHNEALSGIQEQRDFYSGAALTKNIPSSQLFNSTLGNPYASREVPESKKIDKTTLKDVANTVVGAATSALGIEPGSDEPVENALTWAQKQAAEKKKTIVDKFNNNKSKVSKKDNWIYLEDEDSGGLY